MNTCLKQHQDGNRETCARSLLRYALAMKVALVHELLTVRGGAEKVLRVAAAMFPKAPIYTLLYDEKKLGTWFPKERVRTSNLQKFARYSTNHHLYLSRFPAAVEAWDFSEFDLVLSFSSAFAHGIITNGAPRHLCYVHSPARYLWDRTHDVLETASKGFLGPLRRAHLSRTFHPLRTWDAETSDRADRLIAASKTVQRRIEFYWRRESTVIHPPIDDVWLETPLATHTSTPNAPYYFIASTLTPYKRIDLAIEACNKNKFPLKIAGEGRDEKRLRSLAGPTVEFLGFQDEEKLRELYGNARATLFPGDEDFGLVPLESLACGTPVIAYGHGGALETLEEHVTAEFFFESTAASLLDAINRFEEQTFDARSCRKSAERFSKRRFEEALNAEIDAVMKC